MKRLRPPVVVTVSAVVVAGCTKDPPVNPPPPEPTIHANPPALPPPSATASGTTAEVATGAPPPPSASSAAPRRDRVNMADFKRTLNEVDKTRGQIHASDKGCFVWGKWDDAKPRAPGMMPPPIEVPCPASMKDPAWKECIGGSIGANDAGDACACFVGGNPPPPPRLVGCPASAKPK